MPHTHICTCVLRMNTCGKDVCSEQAACKGPHAHRGDESQGMCRGRQREGAGPTARHPRAPSFHRASVRTDPAPGSPPRTPGGWPRRRAGRRSGGHWEPYRHSRDMQRGLGRRRLRREGPRWAPARARVAVAIGTGASAHLGSPLRARSPGHTWDFSAQPTKPRHPVPACTRSQAQEGRMGGGHLQPGQA